MDTVSECFKVKSDGSDYAKVKGEKQVAIHNDTRAVGVLEDETVD